MKQEMISYLDSIKEDIFSLSKYLYENPEEGFNEYKACNYISKILRDKSFKVTDNYLDISTAFYAEYGNGHPKICYICEYDALPNKGHITGHNLISAMSVGAALSLAKVIEHFNSGTVIVIGCPGEFISGAKVTMAKQGTFNDIDAVLMAHPDIENAETGTSMAILPIEIKYTSDQRTVNSNDGYYSALDASNFTFSALNLLKNGFEKYCDIDNVQITNGASSHLIPKESILKFYIRAPKMTQACNIEKKVKELSKAAASLMGVRYEVTMPELPYDELIPNEALSRIFAHNLKEVGIIDTVSPKHTFAGLSLGTVSHIIPCIHPYISIVEDSSIGYATKEFAAATVSSFANDKVLKAASALAMTGLDLVEKEDLLKEVKAEFYANIKDHKDAPCNE